MRYDEQRHPTRREKKAVAVRNAIIILFALCIVAGGIGFAYLTLHANARPTDPATFCPTDEKGPNSITAILIDRTDSFNLTQQAAIRDRLNDVKDHTSKYDLIEIYSVEPTQTQLLKPIFSMCNPGRGEDVNSWTGNPHLIEERWKNFFDEPLQNLFNNILTGEEAAISPIMESIQSIAVTRLDSEKIKSIPRRLIVISDLIQYINGYTQYHPFPNFERFKNTAYYQSVRADLSGVPVDIWYIRRKNTLAIQNEKHQDFWRNYLEDEGATVDKFWFVPGT